MYQQMLPDPGEQQKTLTESKNAANEHNTRFERLLGSFNGSSWTRCWRKGRDSNPRYGCPHTWFPVTHLRPLGHLSGIELGFQRNPDGIWVSSMCFDSASFYEFRQSSLILLERSLEALMQRDQLVMPRLRKYSFISSNWSIKKFMNLFTYPHTVTTLFKLSFKLFQKNLLGMLMLTVVLLAPSLVCLLYTSPSPRD